jgi:hypothetical protein
VLAGSGEQVVIHNLSATGFLMETSAELVEGDALQVELPEHGSTPAAVSWKKDSFYGCEFAVPVPTSAISASLLRNPISSTQSAPQPGMGFSNQTPVEGQGDRGTFRASVLVISGLSVALWLLISLLAVFLV